MIHHIHLTNAINNGYYYAKNMTIVATCTKSKDKYVLPTQQICNDELYTGQGHALFVDNVHWLNEKLHEVECNLVRKTLSVKYGFLNPWDLITTYEETFKTMNGAQLNRARHVLKLVSDFEDIIENADIAIFNLSVDYCKAIGFDNIIECLLKPENKKKQIVFIGCDNIAKQLSFIPNTICLRSSRYAPKTKTEPKFKTILNGSPYRTKSGAIAHINGNVSRQVATLLLAPKLANDPTLFNTMKMSSDKEFSWLSKTDDNYIT